MKTLETRKRRIAWRIKGVMVLSGSENRTELDKTGQDWRGEGGEGN
jgi:hypothetical protein